MRTNNLGPAAVGKTALISWLSEKQETEKKLLRVNNNESTAIQDYVGSYIPNADTFSLQKVSNLFKIQNYYFL